MNLNDLEFKDRIKDKELQYVLKALRYIPEYRKKQLAILLISDTLTKKSAKDILKLL
tara:strand:- start:4669 stop:4839 length:171 start_codon:yes stop_codon:yes gene_type:complete